jgi:NAD(P)-dependent dehydrogenase (short-subunit alcohol dehydrogenase family)
MAQHFSRQSVKLALHAFHGETYELSCDHAWFHADLRDEAAIEQLVKSVVAHYGKVDVLINNAGISRNGMSWKLPTEAWNDVMAVNLTAPFLLMKAVIPGMRERRYGRIISISSIVGQTGMAGTAAYTATKAGLIGLSKTIAKETATSGIAVNTLALGYFDAGMISEVSPELQEQIIKQIPKQRLGDTATILATIDWLLQSEADYVTGQTIGLNGGLYC